MNSLHHARALADNLVHRMTPFCERIEVAGSIRRQKQEVKDIEIVAIPKWHEREVQNGLFGFSIERTNLLWQEMCDCEIRWIKPGVSQIIDWHIKPEGKYWRGLLPTEIKLDLFLCMPENWGMIFVIRTGSADFSARLMTHAKRVGCHVRDGYLWRGEKRIETREEKDVFDLLRLQYIEPVNRIDGSAVRYKSENTR